MSQITRASIDNILFYLFEFKTFNKGLSANKNFHIYSRFS